jgi:hypothetical protein
MRKSLVVTMTLASALVDGRNWAQNNQVDIQFHGFQDTRSVTVLTPSVDFTRDFTDRTTLRANFGVDTISSASDSCARCHQQGIRSHRLYGGLSSTRKYGDVKFTVGGAYSQENFYRSTTGVTSITRDLAKGNTTIAGGFSFSLNQPVVHPLPDSKNQYANTGYVSLTQTLSKTTVAQAGYEIGQINGFQDNPFLRAEVNGELLVGHVPDSRTRQTLSARVRQALPGDTFLEADYRRYFDDWSIRSNMLNVGLSHYLDRQWLVNVAYRRYTQSGAYFYQPSYSGPTPTYFTADFRLEPFNSNDYIAKIVMTPSGPIWWLPAGTGLMIQYERYSADNGFDAAILSTGVQVPLKGR